MKLSDQEQVVLKAIERVGRNRLALISAVIKAVGYPKATTKKLLVSLSNKGAVSLHRHDWPASLKPEQRKMMVKIGAIYFNAVTMRKQNASSRKLSLPIEWQVRPVSWGGVRWQHRQESGDDVYDRTFSNESDLEWYLADRYGWKFARKVLATLKTSTGDPVGIRLNPKGKHLPGLPAKKQRQYEHILESELAMGRSVKRAKSIAAGRVRKTVKKNSKQSKGKTALKTTGRALKTAARGILGAGAQILGAGATALNPMRKRNSARFSASQWAKEMARLRDIKPRPSVKMFGKSGGTPEQQAAWKAQMAEWNRQYRHASKMQKIALEEDNAAFRARQSQNKTKKKRAKRNASRTVNASRPSKVRGHGATRKASSKRKTKTAIRSVAKARKVSVKRASNNPTRKGMRKLYREAKRISKVTRGRYYSSELGQRKAARHEKRHARKSKLNPSAESIRKDFAGSVSGERELFFPQGTPAGKLAKLGKLVSITTEEGTIKPVSGSAWLCADTKGKLHIGSVSGAPLFDGPKRSFGHVTKLEYESRKPHLGYKGPIIWFHHAGEENGIRPKLIADGKGGLVFKGGDYRLTRRGIEN
jgi:hypothetical protein